MLFVSEQAFLMLFFSDFFRLEIECGKTQKLQIEIHSQQRLMAQKDMQIEEGRIAIQTPIRDLENLQREYHKMNREHEDLKKR